MAMEKSRAEAELTNADETNLRAMLASPESFSREFLIESDYSPTLIDKVARDLKLPSHMASVDAKHALDAANNKNNAKISPSSREKNKHVEKSSINSKSNAKGKENTDKPKSPASTSPIHAAIDPKTLLDTQTRLTALAVPPPTIAAAPASAPSPRASGSGWLPSFLNWNTASASVSVSTVVASTTTSTNVPPIMHSHHFAGSNSSTASTTPQASPRPALLPNGLRIDQQSSQSNSDEETSLTDAFGHFSKIKLHRVVSDMSKTNEGQSTDSSLSNTPRLGPQTAAAKK